MQNEEGFKAVSCVDVLEPSSSKFHQTTAPNVNIFKASPELIEMKQEIQDSKLGKSPFLWFHMVVFRRCHGHPDLLLLPRREGKQQMPRPPAVL